MILKEAVNCTVLMPKVVIDGNALYRHPDLLAMRDLSQEDLVKQKQKNHNLTMLLLMVISVQYSVSIVRIGSGKTDLVINHDTNSTANSITALPTYLMFLTAMPCPAAAQSRKCFDLPPTHFDARYRGYDFVLPGDQ